MSRTTLVSGNWKMHLNHLEAIQLVQRLSYELAGHDYNLTEVSLHPPFTDIRSIQTLIDADRMHFKVGAQNVHPEDKGAFTGEVSPPMLAKLNVSYVIVGHSERRQLFGETDEIVNTKAKAVVKHQMTPIVCCGETLEEREAGDAESVVEAQVRGSLAGLSAELELFDVPVPIRFEAVQVLVHVPHAPGQPGEVPRERDEPAPQARLEPQLYCHSSRCTPVRNARRENCCSTGTAQ